MSVEEKNTQHILQAIAVFKHRISLGEIVRIQVLETTSQFFSTNTSVLCIQMEKDKAKEEGTEEAAEEDDEPAAIRQYKKMTSAEKAETSTADSKPAADAQTDVSCTTCQSRTALPHFIKTLLASLAVLAESVVHFQSLSPSFYHQGLCASIYCGSSSGDPQNEKGAACQQVCTAPAILGMASVFRAANKFSKQTVLFHQACTAIWGGVVYSAGQCSTFTG